MTTFHSIHEEIIFRNQKLITFKKKTSWISELATALFELKIISYWGRTECLYETNFNYDWLIVLCFTPYQQYFSYIPMDFTYQYYFICFVHSFVAIGPAAVIYFNVSLSRIRPKLKGLVLKTFYSKILCDKFCWIWPSG